MSVQQMKALRGLLQVLERRSQALQKALEQSRQFLAAAQQRQQQLTQEERNGRERLAALTRAVFTPDALRSLTLKVDELEAAIQQAARGARDAGDAVQRREEAVQQAIADIARHERRIERLRERLEVLRREREAAQEELADEEAEEAANARYVARRRAASVEVRRG